MLALNAICTDRILSRTYSLILDLINTQEELVTLKKGVSSHKPTNANQPQRDKDVLTSASLTTCQSQSKASGSTADIEKKYQTEIGKCHSSCRRCLHGVTDLNARY